METNSDINLLSERVILQLKDFDNYKDHINNILIRIEKDYEIKIFYASETGSRGIGNNVSDSDFDITGFFVPINEMEYFKIVRKYDSTIKIIQEKIFLNNNFFEVDIELWDFKEWLKSKVLKNSQGCDFWFESPLIYKNLYPDLIETVRKIIPPPYLLYWGKAKSGLEYNEKDIKNKGICLNKSLMNVLTNLFYYTHYQIFFTFPYYNIFDEMDYLLKKKEMINQSSFTDPKDFSILEKSVEVYYKLHEDKKKDRKSKTDLIPEAIYDFRMVLNRNFITKKKKSELEMTFNEETAQNLFDKVMKRRFY